jgi:hypothetical protein
MAIDRMLMLEPARQRESRVVDLRLSELMAR